METRCLAPLPSRRHFQTLLREQLGITATRQVFDIEGAQGVPWPGGAELQQHVLHRREWARRWTAHALPEAHLRLRMTAALGWLHSPRPLVGHGMLGGLFTVLAASCRRGHPTLWSSCGQEEEAEGGSWWQECAENLQLGPDWEQISPPCAPHDLPQDPLATPACHHTHFAGGAQPTDWPCPSHPEDCLMAWVPEKNWAAQMGASAQAGWQVCPHDSARLGVALGGDFPWGLPVVFRAAHAVRFEWESVLFSQLPTSIRSPLPQQCLVGLPRHAIQPTEDPLATWGGVSWHSSGLLCRDEDGRLEVGGWHTELGATLQTGLLAKSKQHPFD